MPHDMNTRVTLDDLPPNNIKRWVPTRKAVVVEAVQGGVISLDEACSRYALSVEEFASWQRAIARDGLRGLKVKNLISRNHHNR